MCCVRLILGLLAVLVVASHPAVAREVSAGAAARPDSAGERFSAMRSGLRALLGEDDCDCPPAPEPQDCSALVDALADRIVGGVEVDPPFKYPYAVNLARFNVQEFCGGALIAPNVVLTAAHCDKSMTSVWVGRHDLSDGSGESYESFRVIEKKYPNPAWDPSTYDNDIMLLRLDGESSRRPIAIDTGRVVEEVLTGVPKTTVIGWGTTEWQGPLSPVLREVSVPAIPTGFCNGPLMYNGMITDNMICAAAEGMDSCQGDSGGPMVMTAAELSKLDIDCADEDVLVGLVSWGARCAALYGEGSNAFGYPGVYVKVSNYKDWITTTLKGWGAEPRFM